MYRKLLLAIYLCLVVAFSFAQIAYPITKKLDTVDNYHGTLVPDPFRWLEEDNSDETKAWVKAQNKVTFDYLARIPYRDKVRQRLKELWNYSRYSAPFKKGAYYFFSKNDGLQNQSVWYRQKGINGKAEVFFDPNTLSEDGTASLGNFSFSENGKLIAYSVQRAGSDWQEAYVMEVQTKKKMGDELKWLKFTSLSWKGEEGFFYCRFPEPTEGDKLKGKNVYHKVYYHKLGTPQSEDVLIFEDKEHPQRLAQVLVTEDQRYLVLYLSEGTSGREIRVKDLKDNQAGFTVLIPGFTTQPNVIDSYGDQLLVRTNDGASNYKVVLINPKNPGKENWKEIIPEQKDVLQGVGRGGGYLYADYLKDASTIAYQYTYEGKLVREIKLPGIGTASGFGAEKKDKEFFYSFSSYNYPTTIFHYNISTGRSTLHQKAEVKFNPQDYEVKQVFVTSKDGTKVPVFLTFRKGLILNGQNPVLMYGYGGFNAVATPFFSASNIFFMEQGGVYAHVVLRGGSEYGEAWHKAGMKEHKQNVFDDFISAGEWLVKNKYTTPAKLAIQGRSNGGLLVGAAITQRPDLFKVAIPEVGVLDMLRYHRFTIGYAWAVEYGSSDKEEDFKYLHQYSPLHNLKKGVNYPATMITTADHDDRVVPAHSFKFAASIQESNSGPNPTLIRIETNAGHGGGMPTSKLIELATDTWSFIMYNTGTQFREQKQVASQEVKKAF
jgi:prolyl oligopeptidase